MQIDTAYIQSLIAIARAYGGGDPFDGDAAEAVENPGILHWAGVRSAGFRNNFRVYTVIELWCAAPGVVYDDTHRVPRIVLTYVTLGEAISLVLQTVYAMKKES